jgi:hypothetical protein
VGNQALTTVSQIKENFPHIVVLRYCFNTYFEMLARQYQESFSITVTAPFLDAVCSSLSTFLAKRLVFCWAVSNESICFQRFGDDVVLLFQFAGQTA